MDNWILLDLAYRNRNTPGMQNYRAQEHLDDAPTWNWLVGDKPTLSRAVCFGNPKYPQETMHDLSCNPNVYVQEYIDGVGYYIYPCSKCEYKRYSPIWRNDNEEE